MAVRISRLAILLGVDQKGLSTGLDKSKTEVSSFGKFVNDTLSTALGVFSGQAVLDGVKRLGAVITEEFSRIAEISKTSARLGVDVGELQILGRAAQLAGADFEDLVDIVKDTQVRISEAARGDGILEVFRDDLGLDPKKLLGKTASEQFEIVRAAIERLQNQAQRVRVADELFGDAGVRTLLISGDAIRQARDEVNQFGVALTELDSSAVKEFNESVGRLTLAIQGFKTELATDVAPVFSEVVSDIARALADLRRVRDETADRLVSDPLSFLPGSVGQVARFFAGPDASAPIPGKATGFQPNQAARFRSLIQPLPPPTDLPAFGQTVAAFGKTAFDAFTEPFKRLPDTAKGIAKEFAAGFADAFDGFQKVQAVRRQFAFDQFARQISETLGGPAGVSFGQAGAVRAGTVEAAQIQLDAQTRNAELQASQQIIKETQTTNRILGEIAARQILDSPAVLSLASIPGA